MFCSSVPPLAVVGDSDDDGGLLLGRFRDPPGRGPPLLVGGVADDDGRAPGRGLLGRVVAAEADHDGLEEGIKRMEIVTDGKKWFANTDA